ncbi:hypothetical protein YC2023_122275 [Brassica napus]
METPLLVILLGILLLLLFLFSSSPCCILIYIFASVVIQLTKRDDSVYPGTDHPFRKRITSFLTQGLEKESVNHLCCYNETNDNKSQRESVSSQTEIVGKEVSMRPAYRSSKKVKDYDKLEAEVKKNRRMISFKETLLRTILHNQHVESNGTVLSIYWKYVGAKKIESTLHDDLALKT